MIKSNNSLSDDYLLRSINLRNNQNYVIGKREKTSIILRHLFNDEETYFFIKLLIYLKYIIFYKSLSNNYFKMGVYVIGFRKNRLKSFYDNYEDNIISRIVFKSNDNNN